MLSPTPAAQPTRPASLAWPPPSILRWPRLLAMGAIRLYQLTIGPALPNACRFEPTCSRYSYAAYERYGLIKGSWLTLRRLSRCHPFGGHGYDPVP